MKSCCNVLVYIKEFVSRDQLAEIKHVLDQCSGITNTMMGQTSAKLVGM